MDKMKYPLHLLKLIECLKKLPGIGAKSAERFAFELLKWKPDNLKSFSSLLEDIPLKLKTCASCGALQGEDSCLFCTKEREEPEKLCILASPRDLFAIEGTREFKGYYHVLKGLISPLEGIHPESLNLTPLFKRIETLKIREVIIALDSSVEGDATALYIKQQLQDLSVQVTRLAFGMPMGSSIDFVDGCTLARAFSGRSSY